MLENVQNRISKLREQRAGKQERKQAFGAFAGVFTPTVLTILGATFSSALGSLVAAPRVMQALALQKLLPYSHILGRETENGEPRPAMIANGLIGMVALLLALSGGGLNALGGGGPGNHRCWCRWPGLGS